MADEGAVNRDVPSEQELEQALVSALRAVVGALFRTHPECFYYVTLHTTGEALAPALSAWSHEALARVREERGDAFAELIKWSYADSPYCAFADTEFDAVKRLYAARPDPHSLHAEEFFAECALRLRAMERAVAQLDREGVFGTGAARYGMFVNAEVMPPDAGNLERARRLNPPEALEAWLAEAAECG